VTYVVFLFDNRHLIVLSIDGKDSV